MKYQAFIKTLLCPYTCTGEGFHRTITPLSAEGKEIKTSAPIISNTGESIPDFITRVVKDIAKFNEAQVSQLLEHGLSDPTIEFQLLSNVEPIK